MRPFYIDDSRSVSSGFVVYSWVECLIDDRRDNLRRWLDLRKGFYAQYRIPPLYELHTSKFLNGRGSPSADPTWNGSKKLRGEVVQEALRTIGGCPNLGVGTVYHVVVNQASEQTEDLIHDLVAIIYSFSAGLYGTRRSTRAAELSRLAREPLGADELAQPDGDGQ